MTELGRTAPFPLGAKLDGGRFVVTKHLHGTPDRGIYLGSATNRKDVFVYLGAPQRRRDGARRTELELAGDGDILFFGGLDERPDADFSALVEEAPRAPYTSAAEVFARRREPAAAIFVAKSLARLARGTGALRPETIFLRDGDEAPIAGMATRWFHFHAGAESRCYGVPPMFETLYLAPEVIADVASASEVSDTFSICVMLAEWVTGRHPFDGDGMLHRLAAIRSGTRCPFDGPPALARILDDGLATDPRDRPSPSDLADALERC